jgi:SAM-dependent methyltransferase
MATMTLLAPATRFEFGQNWQRFLNALNDARIETAEQSLLQAVGPLVGKSFLDVGCGSGLFSLAARRLGASVRSFDFDEQSVACAAELKRRHFPGDEDWVIERGSAIDAEYLSSLGRFDVVYAWGVLHHTGEMWRAIELVSSLVADDGQLCLSIYNDQDYVSHWWRRVKVAYNRLPAPLRPLIVLAVWAATYGRQLGIAILTSAFWACCLRNPVPPLAAWWRLNFGQGERGMRVWTDLVDWAGGYPFEVARPEQIFEFFQRRRFTLTRLTTTNGHGCNEFVFRHHP